MGKHLAWYTEQRYPMVVVAILMVPFTFPDRDDQDPYQSGGMVPECQKESRSEEKTSIMERKKWTLGSSIMCWINDIQTGWQNANPGRQCEVMVDRIRWKFAAFNLNRWTLNIFICVRKTFERHWRAMDMNVPVMISHISASHSLLLIIILCQPPIPHKH